MKSASAQSKRNAEATLHSAELARQQAITVRNYLEALRVKSRPGRKRNQESVQMSLDLVEKKLADGIDNVLTEIELLQSRRDLRAELDQLKAQPTIEQYEDRFIEIAVSYSSRKGIDYETWREVGVPADVLARAGIKR